MTKPKITTKPTDPNYTELSQELNELMARLEQGDLDIDVAVECYDRGLQIVSILETNLLQAENRVSDLKAASIAIGIDAGEEE